jgi:hypothetical protein
MNTISKILVLSGLIILSACQAPQLIRPDGFASYENSEHGYKSVSPERIMYRVRAFKNEDNADLAFWKTALKTHMHDSGYIQLSESDIEAKSTPGYLLVLAAPVGAKDYTYMVALFIHKGKLVVFESAGETKYFDKYKDNIIETIEGTNMKLAAQL